MNPTLNTTVNDVLGLPLPNSMEFIDVGASVKTLVEITKSDWNSFEISRAFCSFSLINLGRNSKFNLSENYKNWVEEGVITTEKVKAIEEINNNRFINFYQLNSDVSSEVPLEQVCLTVNPFFRYGTKANDRDLWQQFRTDTAKEFVSYAVGCMMGRYSLDEPGLIYAHSGNVGFDSTRYTTFTTDADGIIPITDELWFADDAPSRIREFLRAVWGPDTLEENMAWLAESLGTKASETPDETIRRYIADKFFKDHLQTYKKRPIYWLFSSGKQGAFQALVYLHRYQEGTLARLRAEYVVPLTSKIQSRVEMLQKDAAAAGSTAARNKLGKEVEKLKKKHVELLAYDEQLRHYADMRITLDLDDGVKVNYGKFGDLLAEIKTVTGGASDD